MGVTIGRLDFKDTLLNFENGDIKSTTTEIVDGNNLVTFLVKTISQSGSGGLVDDTENIKTRNLTGILGSLTLGIVEIGRDGNDLGD